MLKKDSQIRHAQFGLGRVRADDGETIVVRFDHGIEECVATSLESVFGVESRLNDEQWDSPLEVVTRVLAEAICSVNDQWGVFSQSRIQLLPHQLWVCKKVLAQWPTHWLVADDVGLGKTVEAGLILWPLIARGTVSRVLVMCPASLVPQWQQRLKQMFNLRMAHYAPESDTPKADFWHTSPQVIASMQTLRIDHKGRHERMFDAPPWDLLVVDEAHHLNADEQSGPTLGYQLVEKLAKAKQFKSMVFFTGTPHRGKDFGFFALLKLLRPDLFDPKTPIQGQLSQLSQVLIRNNKQCVTDLRGGRLFQPPKVESQTYSYSESETHFYNLLTNFIENGQAYAASLGASDQRMVSLVLIAMQKLASSSVSAIRRAIEGRLGRIQSRRQDFERLSEMKNRMSDYLDLLDPSQADELSKLEEQIAEVSYELALMEDEEPRLKLLVEAAKQVATETKIASLLELIETRFVDRSVLFFTEYKATQSLLMSALMKQYGDDCVTFINGDHEARSVVDSSGRERHVRLPREEAATRFNEGKVRFLVSTEAAGEGIDLQRNCHCLVHVDLPWNPMRMHQRVGRINRYGQTRQVEVVSMRNPQTVESRVWDKLTSKLEKITQALNSVMADPEDLQQLVLGMTSPMLFNDLFTEAAGVAPDKFDDWFDHRTAQFGSRDVLDTVRDLVGHAAKFDFQEQSSKLPQVDLPALKPFFVSMVKLNGRDVENTEHGISFKTPDDWLGSPRSRRDYRDIVFDRQRAGETPVGAMIGVGHVLMDEALRQARLHTACVTELPDDIWPNPMAIYRITDRVTTSGSPVRSVVAAVVEKFNGEFELISDWKLISRINQTLERRTLRRDKPPQRTTATALTENLITQATAFLKTNWSELDLPFTHPEAMCVALIQPCITG